MSVDPLLIHPDPPSSDLVRTLDMGGFAWTACADIKAAAAGRWSAAAIEIDDEDPTTSFTFARAVRHFDSHGSEGALAVLVLARGTLLAKLVEYHDSFDDFCVTPVHPAELEARLRTLLLRRGSTTAAPAGHIVYDALIVNTETYQALIDGRPLDLTYMEYELLKFIAQSPGRVFSREVLLSRVWGYDYYGGARTVDVHIRRLRAKLGEEHAGLIQTVRSVGYRFGQAS